jgi:hypothetical protein
LNSTSLDDSVPLHWKNQLTVRTGFEVSMHEFFTFQAAYAHGNNPVPAATLMPLTAAITSDTVSAGLGYERSRYRLQFAYQTNLPNTVNVGTSGLLAANTATAALRSGSKQSLSPPASVSSSLYAGTWRGHSWPPRRGSSRRFLSPVQTKVALLTSLIRKFCRNSRQDAAYRRKWREQPWQAAGSLKSLSEIESPNTACLATST